MKSIKNYVSNVMASVRRWRWKKSAEKYFEQPVAVGRDTMPPDVATDRLCEIGVRMTNSERRMFSRAREKWLVSAPTARKNYGLRTLRRFEARPLATLAKWNRRAEKRRRGVQRRYEILVTLEGDAAEKAKKVLDQHAAALDLAIDVSSAVLKWRADLAQGRITKPEMVGVLTDPRTGRRLIWNECLDTKAFGEQVLHRKTEFPRWVPLKELK